MGVATGPRLGLRNDDSIGLLYPSCMYRESPPTLLALANALDRRLSPHGFLVVEPDEASRAPEVGVVRGYHRKTWNTNRAVFLARLEACDVQGTRTHVEVLRRESGRVFGSS